MPYQFRTCQECQWLPQVLTNNCHRLPIEEALYGKKRNESIYLALPIPLFPPFTPLPSFPWRILRFTWISRISSHISPFVLCRRNSFSNHMLLICKTKKKEEESYLPLLTWLFSLSLCNSSYTTGSPPFKNCSYPSQLSGQLQHYCSSSFHLTPLLSSSCLTVMYKEVASNLFLVPFPSLLSLFQLPISF